MRKRIKKSYLLLGFSFVDLLSYLTCLGTSWAFRTLFSSAVPEEHPESPPSHANRKKCLHVMIKSLFHIYLKSPPLFVQLVRFLVIMAAAWVQFAPRQGRELVPAFLELVNALFSVFLLPMA